MARFKNKNKEQTEIKPKNDSVDTKLELQKYATQVQSRINKNITSDFTLCKLDEQDKIGVREMTVNAYVAKRKIEEINNKKKYYQYTDGKWYTTKENKKETEKIQELSETAFDMYMTKVMMTAVLNRNVSKNHLLNFLNEQNSEEIDTPEDTNRTNKAINNRIIKDKETKEAQI